MDRIERRVEVIIPTLGGIRKTSHPFSCFERLRHLPWPVKLHIITRGKTWAEAINIGISQTDGKSDIVLMDDDVFINENTFTTLDTYYGDADIFGFKLLFPDGTIQHAGGIVRNGGIGHIGYQQKDLGQFQDPFYVCHATTSLVYIKRRVIDSLKGMAEDIPGIQMEDVDFSFRALQDGFKILYLPGNATHLQSATKRALPNFGANVDLAFNEVAKRYFSNKLFVQQLEEYPKPHFSEKPVARNGVHAD